MDDEGNIKYFVKWTDLGYSECTWETSEVVRDCAQGPEEIEAFERRELKAREKITLALTNRKKEPKREKRAPSPIHLLPCLYPTLSFV